MESSSRSQRPASSYGDRHRVFLQGIMAKGILDFQEVHRLYKTSYKVEGIDVPELRKGLVPLIHEINSELDDLELKIVKVYDEDFYDRKTFYALINRSNRRGLASRAHTEFTPPELEFLRLLVDTVVASEEREIGMIAAVNLTRQLNTKHKMRDTELVIERFVEGRWLRLSTDKKKLRLAPRFIAEMEEYLRENFADILNMCSRKYCNTIVVRGVECPYCDPAGSTIYHLYCLVSMATQSSPESSVPCQKCKNPIEIPGKGGDKKNHSLKRSSNDIHTDSD